MGMHPYFIDEQPHLNEGEIDGCEEEDREKEGC